MCESEGFDGLDGLLLFQNHVFAEDARVCHAVVHVLRNVVVAQKQHLQRKVARRCQQLLTAIRDVNPAFLEQEEAFFAETAAFLDRNSQFFSSHSLFFSALADPYSPKQKNTLGDRQALYHSVLIRRRQAITPALQQETMMVVMQRQKHVSSLNCETSLGMHS